MKPKHQHPIPPPTIVEQRDAIIADGRKAEGEFDPQLAVGVYMVVFAAVSTAVGTITIWGQHAADLIINLL